MRLAVLVLLALLLGGHGSAWAEKAKAKDGAKVFNRAGEQGKVLFKLKEGQVMRVLKEDGRWYKVNVKGRTGWIPRSRVELVEEDVARNTRRRPFVDGRGTKRGFGGGGAPDDRVGADATETEDEPKTKPKAKPKGEDDDTEVEDDDDGDKPKAKAPKAKTAPKGKPKPVEDDDEDAGDTAADEPKVTDDGDEIVDDRPKVKLKGKATVYSEPDDESDEAFKVKDGMVLFVTGKKGKYTEVENEDSDIGYVLTSKVEEVEGGGEVGGRPASRQIDVRARLGVTIIQQGLRSNGPGMLPDNYNLNTSAATISAGGAYLKPYGTKYVLGGEANLDIAKAIPGIKNMGQTTGITLYHLNARGLVGYDLKKKSGMMVFGRLGLRYQSYQVANVQDLTKNTAKLPSEIITSPTVGAALAIPRLTEKVGLRLSLDAMLVGTSLKQTKNLEDGDSPSAKGAVIGAGFSYRWKPNMDIQATYDLNYTKYNFGTPVATSMRGHMGTGDVKRTDVFHGVTVGVAKAF